MDTGGSSTCKGGWGMETNTVNDVFEKYCKKEFAENKEEHADYEVRIKLLEKNDVKQDERIGSVEHKMDKIESNTTWILRLIIGAIILYNLKQLGIY
jgi:hypothetical protein